MKNVIIKYLIIIIVFAFVSCNNSAKNVIEPETVINNSENLELETTKNNEYRVFTLPTPIQFASIIKAYNVKYDNYMLTAINKKIYKSKYERAISSGIYSVNLGYSIIFNDKNNSLLYYNHTIKMFEDLGYIFTTKQTENYKRNIERPDSLYKIFLTNYNDVHQYIIDNREEETGLCIVSGCFLESLNMYCKMYKTHYNKSKKKLYTTLLGQQQIFLNNILEISSFNDVDNPTTKQLYEVLNNINTKLNKFNIDYKNSKFTMKKMPTISDINEIQFIIKKYEIEVL